MVHVGSFGVGVVRRSGHGVLWGETPRGEASARRQQRTAAAHAPQAAPHVLPASPSPPPFSPPPPVPPPPPAPPPPSPPPPSISHTLEDERHTGAHAQSVDRQHPSAAPTTSSSRRRRTSRSPSRRARAHSTWAPPRAAGHRTSPRCCRETAERSPRVTEVRRAAQPSAARLQAGIGSVVAIDPGALESRVLALPAVEHLRTRFEEALPRLLERSPTSGPYDLYCRDMNAPPAVATDLLLQALPLLRGIGWRSPQHNSPHTITRRVRPHSHTSHGLIHSAARSSTLLRATPATA